MDCVKYKRIYSSLKVRCVAVNYKKVRANMHVKFEPHLLSRFIGFVENIALDPTACHIIDFKVFCE